VQNPYSVSKTVTQSVRTNGDPSSCFDGRNNAKETVVLLHHLRFPFQLRKDDRDKIIVTRVIFAAALAFLFKKVGKPTDPMKLLPQITPSRAEAR
jgi:hypothetical protein